MKYPIEKNTVQETLVIPLYGRKMCTERFPSLFRDETALQLMEKIDYDFSELEAKSKSTMQQFGFLEAAMRQNDLAIEVRDYLSSHPEAAVVNLGCGLDNTGRSCDNGLVQALQPGFPRGHRRPGRPSPRRGPGGEHSLRPQRLFLDGKDRRLQGRGVLRRRGVLLLPQGPGEGPGPGHGGSLPRREAGL